MDMDLHIEENFPLAEMTTFKVGGAAKLFVRVESENELFQALEMASKSDHEVFILGGGSNILVSDEGFEGVVIHIDLKGATVAESNNGRVIVTAAAGEDWDEFVGFCVEQNLAGLECLSGIPGLVGGTPIQNVGAYGQEVSESIVSVKAFDRLSKTVKTLQNEDCGFEYRKSIFNTTEKDRYVVLEVQYSLAKNGAPKIVYGDLKATFEGREPSLIETRRAVCEIRESKGMLVRQGGLDAQSAGSFFKNPIVSREKLTDLELKMRQKDIVNVPHYSIDDNTVKIPAAWLIEQAGFQKGFTKGNAGLSTKHTLALTNRGNSTAEEILNLKNEIQQKVFGEFGIELNPEPNLIGFN